METYLDVIMAILMTAALVFVVYGGVTHIWDRLVRGHKSRRDAREIAATAWDEGRAAASRQISSGLPVRNPYRKEQK